MNKITTGKPKSIYDPNSAFMKELEIYKLKSEIKPRKVDMMQAQIAGICDLLEAQEQYKKTRFYVPINGSYK